MRSDGSPSSAASSLMLIKARGSRMLLLPRFADEPCMPHAATLSADIATCPDRALGVNDTQRWTRGNPGAEFDRSDQECRGHPDRGASQRRCRYKQSACSADRMRAEPEHAARLVPR